jgi:hypothetical protein
MSAVGPQQIIAGSTSNEIIVRFCASSDGTPTTGITHSTGGLAIGYRRDGAAVVDDTPTATHAALTDAFNAKEMGEIGQGYYRVDISDAAFAVGADKVVIYGATTNDVMYGPTIDLTDPVNGLFQSLAIDSGSTTTAVISALSTYADDEFNDELVWIYDTSADEWHPAWVTDWVNSTTTFTLQSVQGGGAMPFTIAATDRLWRSGLNRNNIVSGSDGQVAAILTDTNELQTDWANDGRLDVILDARAAEATLGTPAGADLAADVAAVKAETALIVADTNELQTDWANGGRLDLLLDASVLNAALTESYATDGSAATAAELLYMIYSLLGEFSVSGTTLTAKKLDGSTTAGTFTLDSGTAPTSITRAT